MNDPKKFKYLTKKVKFGGKDLTLFSIDGATWSSRKDELVQIIERHENEKLTFGEIRGQMSANKPIAPKKSPEKFTKFRQAALAEKQKAVELVEAEAQKIKETRAPKPKVVEAKKPVTKPKLPEKKVSKPAKVVKAAAKPTPKSRTTGKARKQAVKAKAKKRAA